MRTDEQNAQPQADGPVPAALHPREEERLRSLRSLNVLDTLANDRFDRVTELTSQLLDVPTVLVSLVDENRQWFLSRCGLDATETPRDLSFCAHALHTEELLVIEDATADPRFAGNPLVTGEPYVRFYAGAVLRDRDALPLGTLCAVGPMPRQLADRDRHALLQLARFVEDELIVDGSAADERTQAQLAAGIDPLTHALNPERFEAALEHRLQSADDTVLATIAVTGLDQMNDIFGKQAGDEILVQVHQRLASVAGHFDGAAIGRLSGRRFGLMVAGPEAAIMAEQLSKTLDTQLDESFVTHAGALAPSLDVSIAEADASTTTSLALFERCRAALGDRLSNSGILLRRYDRDQQVSVQKRITVAADLGHALATDAMHLVFQPKIACSDERVHGFECLLRWNHHELGFVSPLDIMDAASEVNLLVKLDRWVIDKALGQQSAWRADGLDPGRMSINVTGTTLMLEDFPDWLSDCMSNHQVDPGTIDIEVLESSLFEDFDRIVRVLERIRALGVHLSLDDFGTGYSSLAYLRNLPVSTLKIDRAFVNRLDDSTTDAALCAAIISLARHLGMSVTAEGVETERQFIILRAYFCDLIQGYYFHKPLLPEDATALLRNQGDAVLPAAA